MKALLLASLLLAGFANAGDRDERRVPLDEVIIKSKEYKAEATLSLKEDGNLILNMQMNGKPVVVPDRILAKLKDARIGSAAFSTETPTGVPVEEARLKSGIILSFYYGPKVQRPKANDVRSACRIKIAADGSFETLETATAMSRGWRLFIQSAKGHVIRDEEVNEGQCPIPMRWTGQDA